MTYGEWLQMAHGAFPNLTQENSRPTSSDDARYNCIAWAAENIERWWWPDAQGQDYWPFGVPRAATIPAFEQAFRLQGFAERADSSMEVDKQKVAIFVDAGGTPTHAARQLPSGRWTSKLGFRIDIEHDLAALEGPTYGTVAVVLARSTRAAGE